jgi:RNA polymerase sigma-70 factor (ECF subfamily)
MTLEASLPAIPPSSRMGEDSLVERLRRGELAAVGEAYDRHHEALRSFARRLLGETVGAEDLVQDVFVALPRAAQSFRGDSSLKTYLISIAVNHCRHHIRSSARKRAALSRASSEPPPCAPFSGSSPEREFERHELAQILSRALDRLSVEHRVTFVLCEVEQLKSREVAKIVGIPEGTVRTRLMFAKKKLRAMLEKEGFR